ncbi:MAG: NirD/YgiW/YdeI family stress tolerance protein [Rickettsiales bacterium]|jgi:uncharacterized protein (TIGR00156 family)|nr:NirD/YgiW/YdeI family stress tolerance protein [Rickettsiales bacterium]
MKYILTILTLALPFAARARFVESAAARPAVSTIAAAKKMSDDAKVVVEGKIQKQIKKDKYLFGDGADTIVVEIDRDVWRGVDVSEKDRLRIFGEVDASLFRAAEIEADAVEIIK